MSSTATFSRASLNHSLPKRRSQIFAVKSVKRFFAPIPARLWDMARDLLIRLDPQEMHLELMRDNIIDAAQWLTDEY
jgi:hypothetical protein